MSNYLNEFEEGMENIEKLVSTPNLMRDIAVDGLKNALKGNLDYTTKKSLENAKQLLENISDSSIKDNYKVIYLQMPILAVSRLEATLKNYFLDQVRDTEKINRDFKKLTEIKITALDLLDHNLSYSDDFGDLLMSKETNTFQNLKLIKEIFTNYLSRNFSLPEATEKNLIYYLELRHVLVHKSGKIDDRFVGATLERSANLRDYKSGDKVELEEDDWKKIKESFTELVKAITAE